MCLLGEKSTGDLCDSNYECYSRCCFNNECSHFLNCYISCHENKDCNTVGGCCSEGYCTQSVVCDANKIIGDVCDTGTECITTYCDSISKTCQAKDTGLKQKGG